MSLLDPTATQSPYIPSLNIFSPLDRLSPLSFSFRIRRALLWTASEITAKQTDKVEVRPLWALGLAGFELVMLSFLSHLALQKRITWEDTRKITEYIEVTNRFNTGAKEKAHPTFVAWTSAVRCRPYEHAMTASRLSRGGESRTTVGGGKRGRYSFGMMEASKIDYLRYRTSKTRQIRHVDGNNLPKVATVG
ncbi:MAG: hypothetical protein Q9217_003155 [Psora testacea]